MGRTHSTLKKFTMGLAVLVLGSVWSTAPQAAQETKRPVTVEQILGFPSPDNLVASPIGSTIAWTFNERGVRNIYVAEGPAFEPRKLTGYTEDDGQELTQLSFSNDGKNHRVCQGRRSRWPSCRCATQSRRRSRSAAHSVMVGGTLWQRSEADRRRRHSRHLA
jgi:hypothetical protein